jgi:hypothetical protein
MQTTGGATDAALFDYRLEHAQIAEIHDTYPAAPQIVGIISRASA